MEHLNIYDVLKPNEQVVGEYKPDKFIYCVLPSIKMLPLGIVWGAFDIFFIYNIFSHGAPLFFKLMIIPFMALHMYPCYSVFTSYVKRKIEWEHVAYVLTTHRVIRIGGALGVEVDSIDHSEIDNVKIHAGWFEKNQGVGTLIISSKNQKINFVGIQEPVRVYKQITKTSFDVKTDIEYPNELRPENNPGYNTKYDQK